MRRHSHENDATQFARNRTKSLHLSFIRVSSNSRAIISRSAFLMSIILRNDEPIWMSNDLLLFPYDRIFRLHVNHVTLRCWATNINGKFRIDYPVAENCSMVLFRIAAKHSRYSLVTRIRYTHIANVCIHLANPPEWNTYTYVHTICTDMNACPFPRLCLHMKYR